MLPENMQEFNEHSRILQEIKELRVDLKDAMNVFRKESAERDDQLRSETEKLKEEVAEERRRVDEALRTAHDTKTAMWKVSGAAITIAITAIAKALGFL